MIHQEAKRLIEKYLAIHLNEIIPSGPTHSLYQYAILPPGKLFRPLLSWAIAKDFLLPSSEHPLASSKTPHSYLMSAIEIHHNYTLIHDDLPCMDNDEFRRGKLSVHKKFGEWQALLAGDALSIASFHLLSQMNTAKLANIIRYFSFCTGPKGLILGQYLDLSYQHGHSFTLLKEIHQLKTSRLIQASIVCSYLLCDNLKPQTHSRYRVFLDLHRLGYHLGLVFQFLDDLTELKDPLSEHEGEINAFVSYSYDTQRALTKGLRTIDEILIKLNLYETRNVIHAYYDQIKTLFNENKEIIEKHHFKLVGKRIDLNSIFDN